MACAEIFVHRLFPIHNCVRFIYREKSFLFVEFINAVRPHQRGCQYFNRENCVCIPPFGQQGGRIFPGKREYNNENCSSYNAKGFIK